MSVQTRRKAIKALCYLGSLGVAVYLAILMLQASYASAQVGVPNPATLLRESENIATALARDTSALKLALQANIVTGIALVMVVVVLVKLAFNRISQPCLMSEDSGRRLLSNVFYEALDSARKRLWEEYREN